MLKVNIMPFIVGILFFLIVPYDSAAQIRYFRTPTLHLTAETTVTHVVASQDSIANDTLFQQFAKEGFPVAYFRKIRTSVCFDNKCRLLKVNLYWNPTGRYLGFELEKGEFLSKAEHKPFTKEEYERMSELLADPLSPLATLAYAEIAPNVKPVTDSNANEVDAVSSATAKNLLDYVVEGAAYTTYKMWHVVYGSTQADVARLTEKSLSAAYLLVLLDSTVGADKIWALNHIRGFVALTPALKQRLFLFIDDATYNLAERAIQALDPAASASESWQLELVTKLNTTSYAIQKLIINKFKEVPILNNLAKKALAGKLSKLSGELISNSLDVFRQHHVTDLETCRIVAGLLTHPNHFIAQKAFAYLEKLPTIDSQIEQQLKEYRQKK